MKFTSVNPAVKEFVKARQWKDWKAGEYLVGEFDNVDHKDKYGKVMYGIKVIENNFGAAPGSLVHINVAGNLHNDMEQVSLGDTLKITYEGKVKIAKGKWAGQLTHAIKVEVAADDTKTADDDLI
jgi:hypothetical protein